MENITIESEYIKAIFDSKSGALIELVNKETNWPIQNRPQLGISFQMLIPTNEIRNNQVLGSKQTLDRVDVSPDGKQAIFVWTRLQSERGGILDISFKGIVSLSPSGLSFEAEVANHSPYTVEAVSYPVIGDISIPTNGDDLKALSRGYSGMDSHSLYPKFSNTKGYYGTIYPRFELDTPFTQSVLITNDKEGLYIGCHDQTAKELVRFVFELKPGFEASSMNTSTVPRGAEISGHPVHIIYSTVHLPFINPGESFQLSPIVFKPFTGNWQMGLQCFREWKKTWYRPPYTTDWAKDVHSWQQIHINSPEDELSHKFTELLKFGQDCARHGVKAIQLVGWNDGGQDRGNPSHNFDPRLGTWEQLHDVIKQIQQLGVKMILFTKFVWADRSMEWYKKTGFRHETKDPHGNGHIHQGYQYQTDTQLADLNTRRFAPMCMMHEDYRTVAYEEFQKVLDLDSDGMLYDECFHHTPAKYCFDPSHNHHVPAFVYGGDDFLEQGFHAMSDISHPEFLYGGECIYGLQTKSYSLSYTRIFVEHVPWDRYLYPDLEIMAAVFGFDDREIINQCLLYRYIISYEPFHFKGRLEDFPLTLEYGKKVDSLRKKYKAYLWDVEFCGNLGVQVTEDGNSYSPYSVFKNRTTGKIATVIVNHQRDNEVQVVVEIENTMNPLAYVSPEIGEVQPTNGKLLSVPPRSAIVVMEL